MHTRRLLAVVLGAMAAAQQQGAAGGRYGGAATGPLTEQEQRLELAIAAGFERLGKHQDEDGMWSASQFVRHDPPDAICDGTGKPDQDFFVSSLVMLAALGSGSTVRGGPQQPLIERGTRWLLAQQHEDGFLGPPEPSNSVVAHAIATYALCEDAGLANKAELRQPLAAAVLRLRQLRLDDGGWPRSVGGSARDGEATLWSAIAMISAAYFGEGTPRCREVPALLADDASVPLGGRLFLGYFTAQPPSDEDCDRLLAMLPRAPDAQHPADFVAWYLGTYACYQMGGERWQKWSDALLAAALPLQRTDGSFAGSWDPVDVHGRETGRVGATALQLLSLVAAERFLRLQRR